MDDKLRDILKSARRGRITVLTGAGVSAESGIPTFRGPEGYWTMGSEVYQPEEIATWAMFSRRPEDVWAWYLYRLGVCRKAAPNPGHLALVRMEEALGERFCLITQNVDNLHIRAGNRRCLEIHGNINKMRCARDCTDEVWPVPDEVWGKDRGESFTDADRRLLRCPRCGGMARPHVLLFDECYNEIHYHLDSALNAAAQSDLLLVAGTSGATNLPNQIVHLALHRGASLVDVNPGDNPFGALASGQPNRFAWQAPGATALPEIADLLCAA